MAKGTAELIECLNEEKAVYQQLLMFGAEKKDVLIKCDVPELELLTCKERETFEILRRIEERRLTVTETLVAQLGITEKPVRLSRIVDAVSPEERLELELLWDQLKQILAELAKSNLKNKQLIDIQLRYANCFIDALTGGTAAGGNTYNGSGAVKPKQNTRIGLINQRA